MNINNIKIAILVPVYNWNIRPLIESITAQVLKSKIEKEVEVYVIDDYSNLVIHAENLMAITVAKNLGVILRYSRNEKNLGRSETRNRLLKFSASDFCLFLDSDVLPDSINFIKKYMQYADQTKFDVICGGISYKQVPTSKKCEKFYLRQGSILSVASAKIRNTNPWKFIFTSNVMVSRRAIEGVPFNADYIGYGYEDIEWAIRLSRSFKILHIDNTASHLGLLTDSIYYKKMSESTKNLAKMIKDFPIESNEIKVVRVARLLKVMPKPILLLTNYLFVKIYYGVNSFKIKNISFQLSKCLLAALQLKQQNYPLTRRS